MMSPLRSAIRAFREMTLLAPPELDQRVRAVVTEFIARRGFPGFSTYAPRSAGRPSYEVYILLPRDFPIRGIADLDAMRARDRRTCRARRRGTTG
jgi:predicted Co/Zn/Cd cation transporter (cation efflux family)